MEATIQTTARKRKGQAFRDFMVKFRKHKMAQISLAVFLLEILLLILLPMVLQMDPNGISTAGFNAKPGPGHILGTDSVGRDLFARLIYGGQISLFVGISATVISVLFGLPLGLLAGYYRGPLEAVIMRAADIFMSFPAMILVLVLVAIFGNSLPILILVIGLLGWPQIAKLIYGNVLSVRKKEYIEAERAIGTRDAAIIWKNVLPNSIAPLWMSIAFRVSSSILTESALSFLGAGVQPPMASWGNILNGAQNIIVLSQRPWAWMPAAACLVVTVVAINFIGEGVRDALDPKMKR